MGRAHDSADKDEFDYAAVSCRAFRTFRLKNPIPVVAEFYSVRYELNLRCVFGTGNADHLVALLPWQNCECGQELDHAACGVIKAQLHTAYDVACGTLLEVLFLRLVRQGDAEELAGPHVKLRFDCPLARRYAHAGKPIRSAHAWPPGVSLTPAASRGRPAGQKI